jgi:DNA invertase Pin-like site-specific DNA recombinase
MKTIAYLRVSKDSQDVRNQRLAILEFARQEQLTLTDFMELSVSSRCSPKERQIDVFLARLEAGDTLVVSEVSRMGRSVGEILTVIDALVKQKVRFLAIKEGIRLEGKQDVQSKVMVTLFSLFADIERELISLRTKEGLAAARAAGKRLGRPKGKLGWSKLTGKEEEIQKLLHLQVLVD